MMDRVYRRSLNVYCTMTTPTRTVLLQRGADRREIGFELGTDALDGENDRERDANHLNCPPGDVVRRGLGIVSTGSQST